MDHETVFENLSRFNTCVHRFLIHFGLQNGRPFRAGDSLFRTWVAFWASFRAYGCHCLIFVRPGVHFGSFCDHFAGLDGDLERHLRPFRVSRWTFGAPSSTICTDFDDSHFACPLKRGGGYLASANWINTKKSTSIHVET